MQTQRQDSSRGAGQPARILLIVVVWLLGRVQVGAQAPGGSQPLPPPRAVEPVELDLRIDLPTRDQLFRAESEATSRQRERAAAPKPGVRMEYPPEPLPAGAGPTPGGRALPPSAALMVPDVVCYHPLYFQDKNSERYAWNVPLLQPAISTAKFYIDLALLPYNMGVRPPWACECSSGYPKPGDPVPYYIYLPPWSWKGALLEAKALVGGIALIH